MKNCAQVTALLEEKKLEELSFLARLDVKLHLALCKVCKNYLKDSQFINRLLQAQHKRIERRYAESEKEALKNVLKNAK